MPTNNENKHGTGSKTLYLNQKKKSDWNHKGLTDFQRPLNDRGNRDAPMMGKRLFDKHISIDAFIASPALRAKTTAELIVTALKKDPAAIIFAEELYLAPPTVFIDIIKKLSNDAASVAIVAHNPGIMEFAGMLTDNRIGIMPTCSIVAVSAECETWVDFENAKKQFLFFDYPKANS